MGKKKNKKQKNSNDALIQQFNKEHCKQFRLELDNDLQQLFSKYGIKHKIGTISYSDFEMRMTLTLNAAPSKESNDANQTEIETYLKLTGIPTKYAKKKIKTKDGRRLKIIGINHRARKAKIRFLDIDKDKTYRCDDSYIKQMIGMPDERIEFDF